VGDYPGNIAVASTAIGRNWPCARAQPRLLLNLRLSSADAILQTTIHLRPLTVPGVDFADGPGYPQIARDEHSIFDITFWPDIVIFLT